MANPHRTMEIQIQLEAKGSELHLSLNYSKSKEKIWDQHQLTSNQKKIKFKTLPPFFIFWIFGHHLPRANNGLLGGGRKQHLDFYGSFLGAGDAITCPYTTGDCCFAVCQSTRQSPICTRQRLCRVPHTEKSTRHSDIGKGDVCGVPFSGHTSKPLPCAKADPRQKKKQKTWEVMWRPPLLCACKRGTRQSSNVCRVPQLWHTVNIGVHPFSAHGKHTCLPCVVPLPCVFWADTRQIKLLP